jgi:transcriptional regulator with XRE-family HTH domain
MYAKGVNSVAENNFAAWLEYELAARNWRPADLAKAADVPQATISNILNGNREVGAKVAKAIADALDLSPEYVFRRAGLLPDTPGPERDPTFQEILEIMRNMTEEERREIVDYALFRFRRSKGQ